MDGDAAGFAEAFPLWGKLDDASRETLSRAVTRRAVPAGTALHNGSSDCIGLLAVESGQLRAFIRSEAGKEVTMWRLLAGDVCLLSASCMLHDIQFDITVDAERDTVLWVIPAEVYRSLMDSSAVVANYTSQLMASRLTDAMWLVEQVMWQGFDVRLCSSITARRTSAHSISGSISSAENGRPSSSATWPMAPNDSSPSNG
jgi:CRP/FNR family transcriptional regulator